MAIQAGNGKRVTILYHNLASPLASYEGPRAAVQLLREAIDFAAARGLRAASGYLMLELLLRLVEIGEIDEAVAFIARLRPELEAGGSVRDLDSLSYIEVRVLALRGEAGVLKDRLPSLSETVTRAPDTFTSSSITQASRLPRHCVGNRVAAVESLEALQTLRVAGRGDSSDLLELQRVAVAIDRPEFVERLADVYVNATPYGEHVHVHAAAAIAEVRGDFAAAASGYGAAAARWEDFGVVTERAFAMLGQGRCMIALGDVQAATAALTNAREIFAALRAAPALAEVDALIDPAEGSK